MNFKSLSITNLKSLDGFHNQIYQGVHQGNEIIIRVTPMDERRTYKQLQAEMDLLETIKDDVPVGQPYAINGEYVMNLDGYFVVFFHKVQGCVWHELMHDQSTYHLAGKNLALLHNALYESGHAHKRDRYDVHPDIKLISKLDLIYRKALSSVLEEMATWQKKTTEYGLIHGDYLYSNMIYQENELVIIDFDDIEYHFYMYDIAVYLFYYLLGGNPSDINIESNIDLFLVFMKAYEQYNRHIQLDFTKIQTLFRLRQLKLLATIKTNIPKDKLGPWQIKYVQLTDQQVADNKPFVDIDYVTLYARVKGNNYDT